MDRIKLKLKNYGVSMRVFTLTPIFKSVLNLDSRESLQYIFNSNKGKQKEKQRQAEKFRQITDLTKAFL